MKKRGCLVFALCAMAGALTLSCADDSGNSKPKTNKPEITVDPAFLTMNVNDSRTVNVEYEAKMDLVATSSDDTCVKVDNGLSKDLTTNGEGKVSFTATAARADCSAKITVEDKEDSRIFNNVEVTVVPEGTAIPVLTLSPSSMELAAGGSANLVATLTVDSAPKANDTLTVTSTNPACITVPATVTTSAEGKADIQVTAAEAGDCNATVNVKPSLGESKGIPVTVLKKGEEPEPPAAAGTLAYDKNSVTIAPEATGSVMLSYVDGEGNGIGNVTVNFSYTNESCVKTSVNKKSPLGADGTLNITITPNGSDCNTDMTATVKGPDGDITATVAIAVTNKTKFVYDLDVQINNAKKFDKIGYVAYAQRAESCDDMKASGLMQVVKAIMPDEDSEANGSFPSLHKFAKIDGDTETYKSVVAFGKGNQQGDVLALNCKDVSVADDNNTVVLELEPVPTNIIGKYDLTTNFDLTSGFEKTACTGDTYQNKGICVPAVENMKPGDWVKFVTNFCKEPLITLLEFAWSNTIDRLINLKNKDGSDALPDWLKGVLGTGTKTVALAALEPYLDGLLGETGDWYKILKIVGDDIEDLTTNMQLYGTLDVAEADGTIVKKATEEYKELQYQWSYKKDGEEQKNCIVNPYGKAKCRKAVRLSAANKLNMSGEWNGTITLGEENDLLDINSHSLDFRWASMLFVAVFGSILPEALDYKANDGTYIKAFLNKVLFGALVTAYNNDPNHTVKVEAEAGKECEAFLEVVIRLVKPEMDGTMLNIARSLSNMACADNLIGKLDTLLLEQLDKFQATTQNALNLSSKACTLYDEGTINYTKIGEPEPEMYTANDVLDQKKKTTRCTWDVDFSINDKPVTLKGIYHATRQP